MNPIKWAGQMLQGTDGSPSMIRVGAVMVLGTICIEHIAAAIHGSPQVWDWQQVATVVGTLAAKATQRAFEQKPEATIKPI